MNATNSWYSERSLEQGLDKATLSALLLAMRGMVAA